MLNELYNYVADNGIVAVGHSLPEAVIMYEVNKVRAGYDETIICIFVKDDRHDNKLYAGIDRSGYLFTEEVDEDLAQEIWDMLHSVECKYGKPVGVDTLKSLFLNVFSCLKRRTKVAHKE